MRTQIWMRTQIRMRIQVTEMMRILHLPFRKRSRIWRRVPRPEGGRRRASSSLGVRGRHRAGTPGPPSPRSSPQHCTPSHQPTHTTDKWVRGWHRAGTTGPPSPRSSPQHCTPSHQPIHLTDKWVPVWHGFVFPRDIQRLPTTLFSLVLRKELF